MRIWTIGHSTRTIEKFISLLEEHGIKSLADVRLLPGSKRYPQFNKETLADSLSKPESATNIFPSLVAEENQGRIPPIQPGAMNHFAVTPITWKQKSSTKVLSAFS